MQFVLDLLINTILYILRTIAHNFPALAIGVFIAAGIKVYLDPEKMKAWLLRQSSVSIPATVAFGAFTPLCACGTMAVVVSMLATALPWGPIMAFLTSSPLMSPAEFVLISGIIGPSFAVALTAASVIIGLGSGYMTHVIEKKTSYLHNQLRFVYDTISLSESIESCCLDSTLAVYCCDSSAAELSLPASSKFSPFLAKYKIVPMVKTVFDVGIRRILPLFALFAAIGHLINEFIPSGWIAAVFGAQNIFAVPLAALVGIPLYVNGDSSIPLIQTLMQNGVSSGAMLAFMVTGPGTSAGAIAGILTIMKKKAVALYVMYLLVGAILVGYLYDWMQITIL
jgi:uncharacterized protein